jgi:hypothetical protein
VQQRSAARKRSKRAELKKQRDKLKREHEREARRSLLLKLKSANDTFRSGRYVQAHLNPDANGREANSEVSTVFANHSEIW